MFTWVRGNLTNQIKEHKVTEMTTEVELTFPGNGRVILTDSLNPAQSLYIGISSITPPSIKQRNKSLHASAMLPALPIN